MRQLFLITLKDVLCTDSLVYEVSLKQGSQCTLSPASYLYPRLWVLTPSLSLCFLILK